MKKNEFITPRKQKRNIDDNVLDINDMIDEFENDENDDTYVSPSNPFADDNNEGGIAHGGVDFSSTLPDDQIEKL